jgi:IPT/TIG domain-containing protein
MNLKIKTLILLAVAAAGMGCGYSKPKTTSSMPAIAQLNPASVTAGGATFQLEVDGMNFASNAVVNFRGTAEQTMFVSATKLEATIPAAAIAASGAVPVTVTNPGTSGIYGTPATTSAAMNFTVN